jgi:hypothetical protein
MVLVKALENFGLILAGETGYMMDLERAKKAQEEGKVQIINRRAVLPSLRKEIEALKKEETKPTPKPVVPRKKRVSKKSLIKN